MEATACVKVLLASDSGLEKGLTIEAPLMINIPTKSTINSSESQQPGGSLKGINITVPVCVQKQPLPPPSVAATSTEDLDKTNGGGGGGNLPLRRKRNPWTEAEDMELFAAVQKCGEGNWANILKGDFKGERTASQLSQRWNIIKKRRNGNPNNQKISNNSNVKTGSQLSEVHLAARRALNMALDQPGSNSLKASSLGRTKSGITSMRPKMPDTCSGPTIVQDQSNEDPSAPTKAFPKILAKTSTRTLVSGADPVKAAAVAAGARIATPSAAAAILKQQLKSASHIKTSVSSFRDVHSPNTSRPLEPFSTAGGQETNVSSMSSSEKAVVMGIRENEKEL
ncbi:uncharacterized protein LOC143558497 [Bidens hawaiensis]|uniref:uncharacterized protein LOC143558497 n=1 Tax=Bidens hawaiensis TaxID=980011 RepID=UPI0040498990